MREKQNPVEKEWAAVVKAEERFLRHAMPARTAGWQEKITRYVPQKLEATLHTAFYKAFELIFDKGTPVIEKTYQREKKEQNYKINAYTAEVRDTRHALRAFGREAETYAPHASTDSAPYCSGQAARRATMPSRSALI